MKLRIGLVGCGKIADGHLDEIRKLDNATLVSVCDQEPLMAEQLALRYGNPLQYTDFDRMLAEQKLDVVHIATPPQAHPFLAIRAMEAGCHVFVEKPFALDTAAAQPIIDTAERLGRKVSINYWYNFEPPALELQQWHSQGKLGDIVHVESHFGYSLSGDFGSAVLGDPSHWVHQLPGRLFHNVLDHIVNKITWFLPDEDPQVTVVTMRRRPATGDPAGDSILDELRFVLRGKQTTGYGTFTAHASPVVHALRVYGAKDTAHLNFQNRTLTHEAPQTIPSALGRLFPAFAEARMFRAAGRRNLSLFAHNKFHYFAGMNTLFHRFYQSIIDGAPPPIPHSEILRVSRIMDEIIRQVQLEMAR
jgi:predicted dehydrogenase